MVHFKEFKNKLENANDDSTEAKGSQPTRFQLKAAKKQKLCNFDNTDESSKIEELNE